MARYSDKDKKKPAAGYGEQTPPPPPLYGGETPEPIEAEEEGGGCDLRVVVFAGEAAEPEGAPPIRNAKVTLTSGSFHQSKRTDRQGEACWRSLEPAEYWVEVTLPRGYQSETARKPVTLTEGQEAVLYFGLQPEEATLRILAYHDTERCGDPAGQPRIRNLRFEALQEGESLGSGKTGEDGTGSLPLSHTGWIEVRIQGLVRSGGQSLLPAAGDRQLVLLEPGKDTEVRIAYVSGLAELTVDTILAGDDPKDEDVEDVPLHGVGLALYAPGSNVPRKEVTEGERPTTRASSSLTSRPWNPA